MARPTAIVLSMVLLDAIAGATAAETDRAIPSRLLTVAERTDFRATASYEETLDFIRGLSREMPEIGLETFGVSPEGRPLPLVVVAAAGADDPARAAAAGKAVVLIQNGIHAGEIDGKDACLMILRDMVRGRHRAWLDSLVLLIVPIYNVDGHERVSPYNRANQNGPVDGMGFRTTADGHDLNRDHLKLETPEARAMIGLFNRWRPQLHVDNHVTNGSDHDWVLTYSWAEAPQLAPSLHDWVERILPVVVERTANHGHRLGPYVWLLDDTDPSAGFRSWVGEPRYATGYYPLRNRPSILV
ncbi:MAG TPA: M14 family metallopeptidase, partial [Candidatus Polarisedimenticolaceae bacterium]|nr:M14 family metallopeptidase [Candidatus Polarisedimenticolaceae bacterium]